MRAAVLLLLASCFPQPQPAQPYPTAADYKTAACVSTNQRIAVTYCTTIPSPLPTSWAEGARRDLDTFWKDAPGVPATCTLGQLPQAETCVMKLETLALQQDPEARARRDREKPKAASIQKEQRWHTMVADIERSRDQAKIVCDAREQGFEYQRECDRRGEDIGKHQDRLREYLKGQGIDPRDFIELALWP